MAYRAGGGDSRITGALLALLVQALLGYALIRGFGVDLPGVAERALQTFTVLPPPPPPPREKTVPHRIPSHKREGAASPANLRAKATEIVAPVPVIPPPVPPPIPAAKTPGVGAAAFSGASDRPGPGTGSGGIGNGTGSGGRGDGEGDGGDDTPPRQIRGSLRNSDFNQLADVGDGGTVGVRFRVETDGRVSDCRIDASSGNPDLDALTCRLIEQRFRFAPSRDASGRPVRSTVVENHTWEVHRETERER